DAVMVPDCDRSVPAVRLAEASVPPTPPLITPDWLSVPALETRLAVPDAVMVPDCDKTVPAVRLTTLPPLTMPPWFRAPLSDVIVVLEPEAITPLAACVRSLSALRLAVLVALTVPDCDKAIPAVRLAVPPLLTTPLCDSVPPLDTSVALLPTVMFPLWFRSVPAVRLTEASVPPTPPLITPDWLSVPALDTRVAVPVAVMVPNCDRAVPAVMLTTLPPLTIPPCDSVAPEVSVALLP